MGQNATRNDRFRGSAICFCGLIIHMVQVDVFWSYGLNAGLAIAAQGSLRNEERWFESKSFLMALLWTAALFAPSGAFLLWINPGWETMFVAQDHASIPAWLVALFAMTNVTQGVLGFGVTARLIRAGKMTAAWWQALGAHLAMFFILIVGWDGTGYRRFFYAGNGEQWHQGQEFAFVEFFSSTIFYSLLGLGVILVPTYIWCVRYLKSLSIKVN